jgi:hypothetical protein
MKTYLLLTITALLALGCEQQQKPTELPPDRVVDVNTIDLPVGLTVKNCKTDATKLTCTAESTKWFPEASSIQAEELDRNGVRLKDYHLCATPTKGTPARCVRLLDKDTAVVRIYFWKP